MIFKKLTLTHYIFIGLILGAFSDWVIGAQILPMVDPLTEIN
jgi:hypothetical protein